MTDKPLTALYVGYTTGTQNHGDEALIWIIRDLLAPEIRVVTEADHFDVALLGGGTLINQSPWLIYHFAEQLDKAGHGIVFGTGVGDLFFWGNRFSEWVPLLQRCEAVGVRGPMSVELLQRHGFADAVDIGDPYLWLRSPIDRAPIPKHLGVNIGSTNNALWGAKDDQLFDHVAGALEELERRGWTFSFLSVWEKDLPLIDAVRTRLSQGDSYPVIDARSQTLEAYSMLASCQVFLGEKLHANAMAAVAGTPFLALEYQPKVRDFAASISMNDHCISTADATSDVLVKRIEELAADSAVARDRMITYRDELRTRLLAFADQVKHQLVQKASNP